jgi:hypothetical protein
VCKLPLIGRVPLYLVAYYISYNAVKVNPSIKLIYGGFIYVLHVRRRL